MKDGADAGGVIQQLIDKDARIAELKARVEKLQQQVYLAGVQGRRVANRECDQRVADLEAVIKRLEPKPKPEPKNSTTAAVTALISITTALAGRIRKLREHLDDHDDMTGYIEFLENKLKEKDRGSDSADETTAAKQVNELAEVLMHEFGSWFDRSEGAVDMAVRLLRGFTKP